MKDRSPSPRRSSSRNRRDRGSTRRSPPRRRDRGESPFKKPTLEPIDKEERRRSASPRPDVQMGNVPDNGAEEGEVVDDYDPMAPDDYEMNETEMMAMMGFPTSFDSTKGKKVQGNDMGGVKLKSKRIYRQYMNRAVMGAKLEKDRDSKRDSTAKKKKPTQIQEDRREQRPDFRDEAAADPNNPWMKDDSYRARIGGRPDFGGRGGGGRRGRDRPSFRDADRDRRIRGGDDRDRFRDRDRRDQTRERGRERGPRDDRRDRGERGRY